MTASALSQIIGTAVIDDSFRRVLLRNPSCALAQFDLNDSELRDIAAIRANTIEQFAEQLIVWMKERDIA